MKVDTNNRNEETHFLFIEVIDVTSKDCAYTSFVGDSRGTKAGAIRNKGANSLGTSTRAKMMQEVLLAIPGQDQK